MATRRVPDEVPRLLVDVAVRPADGLPAVGALGADRGGHQRPADQADQGHGHEQAQQDHQRPQQAGHQMSPKIGIMNGKPNRTITTSKHEDEQQWEQRRGDVGQDAFQGEVHGVHQADLLAAGHLHGGDARDGPAEHRPRRHGPDQHAQEIKAALDVGAGAEEVDDRQQQLHDRLDQHRDLLRQKPLPEVADFPRLAQLPRHHQERVRPAVLEPRPRRERAVGLIRALRSFRAPGRRLPSGSCWP